MRQFKFRAFNNVSKKMYYEHKVGDVFRWQNEGQVQVIMQYTGLRDKNGVEIYEGDIVQHMAWDYPFKIIFNQEKARFVCEMRTGLTSYISTENLEVIGNIHQNQDLLK